MSVVRTSVCTGTLFPLDPEREELFSRGELVIIVAG